MTPATLQMCITLVVGCALGGGLAASGAIGGAGVAIGVGAGLLLLAVGGAAVALVGVAQRRA